MLLVKERFHYCLMHFDSVGVGTDHLKFSCALAIFLLCSCDALLTKLARPFICNELVHMVAMEPLK